jgi:DNA polymerase
MDESARLQYLDAMGIDVWVPRQHPVAKQTLQAIETYVEESGQFQHVTPNINCDDHAWTELRHKVAACDACKLCESRTQTVFGVGNQHASWLLIGEAPGQNEDLQGEPFVGKAGQLLNEMLRAIGLQRQEVYIANMLKCRPPNNRDPQAEEMAACHGFLQQQIAMLQPKIILAVGRIAAQNLLSTSQPLAKLRGRLHSLENIPLVVVHHPAYLLRSLTEKAKAWDDSQFALSVYQSLEH